MKRKLAATLGVSLALALPAAAQTCGDGERAFEHLGGTTCIPDAAERIVSLHDQQITMVLIETDAPVIGSHGRPGDGDPFMRGVRMVFGLDFDNSGIAFVGGFGTMDFEAIAATEPDLIIGREWDIEARAQYEAIAPTVFIDVDADEPLAFARNVADAAGTLPVWDRMNAAFEESLDRARTALPGLAGQTYAKIQGWEGTLNVYAGYGALTYLIAELGLERMPLAQEMADRGVAWGEEMNAEILPELDADYVFDTYTIAYNDVFTDPADRLAEVSPAWCDVLSACREGRYIVLPREFASGFSFSEMNTALHLVTTHLGRSPAQ